MLDQAGSDLTGLDQQDLSWMIEISAHLVIMKRTSEALTSIVKQNLGLLSISLDRALDDAGLKWFHDAALNPNLNSSIFSSDLLKGDTNMKKIRPKENTVFVDTKVFRDPPVEGTYVFRIIANRIGAKINGSIYSYAIMSVTFGLCTQYRACFNLTISPFTVYPGYHFDTDVCSRLQVLVASSEVSIPNSVLVMLDAGGNYVPANVKAFCPVQNDKVSLVSISPHTSCSEKCNAQSVRVSEVVSIEYSPLSSPRALGLQQGYVLQHKVEITFSSTSTSSTVIMTDSDLKVIIVGGSPRIVTVTQMSAHVSMRHQTVLGNISASIADISANIILERGGNISAKLFILYRNDSVNYAGNSGVSTFDDFGIVTFSNVVLSRPHAGTYMIMVQAFDSSSGILLNPDFSPYPFIVLAGDPYFISLISFSIEYSEEFKFLQFVCKILMLDANRNVIDRNLKVNVTVSYRPGQFFWKSFSPNDFLYNKIHDLNSYPAEINSKEEIKHPVRGRLIDIFITYNSNSGNEVVLQRWPSKTLSSCSEFLKASESNNTYNSIIQVESPEIRPVYYNQKFLMALTL
jgi:hypothetical protein